jgi:hypothetical protein
VAREQCAGLRIQQEVGFTGMRKFPLKNLYRRLSEERMPWLA